MQSIFRIFIQTESANNGVEQKKRWVSNGVEDPGGGFNVAGASVHRHHFGSEEGRGTEAAYERVRVELLPLFEEVFAGERLEYGGVGRRREGEYG